MENRSVSSLMARRWWIVLLILAATLGAAYYFTRQQPPLYQSRVTYVARLSESVTNTKDINTALDVLNRQKDLLTTFTEIAKSRLIQTRANQRIDPSGSSPVDLTINSRLIPATNILEISVTGRSPGNVRDFASALGEETAAYANSLYSPYRLELLDEAQLPLRAVSPNLINNLVIAGIIGLCLGFLILLFSLALSGAFRSAAQEEQTNMQSLLSFQADLESLKHQSNAMRKELAEARKLFRDTVLEVRILGSTLHETNGSHK